MKSNAKELEKAKLLTEARRIFADAENYRDDEIMMYANIVKAVFCTDTFDTIEDNDIVVSKLRASLKTLSTMESAALSLRYGAKKSCNSVAETFCRTRERVRNLETNALKKMRQPSRVAIYSVSKRNLQLEDEPKRNVTRVLPSRDSSIVALKLSVRSYNCLMQAGITTVEQLLNTPDDEIIRIRGIGEKSYEELTSYKKAFSSK